MITKVAAFKYGTSLSAFLGAHLDAEKYTFDADALNNGECDHGDGDMATSDVLETVGECLMITCRYRSSEARFE